MFNRKIHCFYDHFNSYVTNYHRVWLGSMGKRFERSRILAGFPWLMFLDCVGLNNMGPIFWEDVGMMSGKYSLIPWLHGEFLHGMMLDFTGLSC